MGGFGAALGGALEGIGNYAHEQNLIQLQQNAQQKDALMGFYKSILDNPNLEHMAPEAAQAYLHISTTPIDNKWQNNVAKFAKQYDPQVMNEQALTRHAQQHPGVQAAQQLQLPPGLVPPKISGVPGQTAGDADGAGHQAAMQTPGAGMQQSQQPQQQPQGQPQGQGAPTYPGMPDIGHGGGGIVIPPSSVNIADYRQMTPPPQQQQQQAQQAQQQSTDMLAATTGAVQGNLPNAGPVPQVSPSPAQASAAAGMPQQQQPQPQDYTQLLGAAPVMPDSMQHPHFGRTPAEKSDEAAYQQAVTHRQQLTQTLQEQEALSKFNQQQRAAWLAQPEVKAMLEQLPPAARMMFTAPVGMQVPNMTGLMTPHLVGTNVSGREAPDGQLDHSGNAVDPAKTYAVRSVMGQDVWVPQQVRQTAAWMADPANPAVEIQVHVDPLSGAVSAVAGPNGKPLTRVKTGMVGTASSTTDSSGNTTTSTRRKVMPGGGAGVGGAGGVGGGVGMGSITAPPSSSAGGGGGSSNSASPAVSPSVKRYADDYTAGRIKLSEIPVKQRDQVQRYLEQAHIASPDNVSERGKSDLAALDPVLGQIHDLRQQFAQGGLSRAGLIKDYEMYKHGFSTPHDALFTGLSFEALRSGAAAMKGTGSRALPIFNKALEHTPTLDRMGGLLLDDPKLMDDKLAQMEKILTQGRDSIMQDERRVGTVSPAPGKRKSLDEIFK